MKYLLTLTFIIGSLASFATQEEAMPIYWLKSSVLDKSLQDDQAVYVFEFNQARTRNHSLIYSIDGVTSTVKLHGKKLEILTTPGKHIFQFYHSQEFEEVYTDSIAIKARHRNTYGVPFNHAYQLKELEKPVIYLYPEAPTEVQVVMDIKGENPYLYPAYDQCWKFTAHPNGDLTFGENTYNYLFWEASDRTDIISDEGFVVAGANSTQFLEDKLTEIGLTSKERADFITYWAPRMNKSEHNFVQFIFNEACDRYATMDITPQPDNIFRVYMVWTSTHEGYKAKEQPLEKVDRSGFTVIEWGGQQTRFRRINCMAHEKIEL